MIPRKKFEEEFAKRRAESTGRKTPPIPKHIYEPKGLRPSPTRGSPEAIRAGLTANSRCRPPNDHE